VILERFLFFDCKNDLISIPQQISTCSLRKGEVLHEYCCLHSSFYHWIQRLVPEFLWLPWKFSPAPRARTIGERKGWFDLLGKEIGMKCLGDWYNLNLKVTARAKRQCLGWHFSQPSYVLPTIYPEHRWIPWLFFDAKLPFSFWKGSMISRYLTWFERGPLEFCFL